ncbi:MAG: hypothetical protein KC561_13430 [Myxococcales bacterium]|nr:hypothetical protein [Myxococcales bacterium]
MTTSIRFLLLLLFAVLAGACAEADGPSPTPTRDSSNDQSSDSNVPDETADSDEDDQFVMLDESSDDQTSDDSSDTTIAQECEPHVELCDESGTSILRCSRDGEWFDPSPCDEDEVCEMGDDGPECVDCTVGVNCVSEEPVCTPNQPLCADFQTAAICNSEGQIGQATGCQPGRCFGGGCRTSGQTTGAICTANTGCVGRLCLCGDDAPTTDQVGFCADQDLRQGYCSTESCDRNGCSPNEVCVDMSQSPDFGSEHYCVERENCSQRLANCAGGHRGNAAVCRSLPAVNCVTGTRTWELGCFAPPPSDPADACADNAFCMAPIGGACNSNADCIGGLCMKRNGLSYCSAVCDENMGCPGYAECVRIDSSNNAYCLARAVASNDEPEPCPRDAVEFDINVQFFPRLRDGISTTVCFFKGGGPDTLSLPPDLCE